MDGLRGKEGGRRKHQSPDREAPLMGEWDDGGALTGTYVSSDGGIIQIDELLDSILSKDEKRKRRFSTD